MMKTMPALTFTTVAQTPECRLRRPSSRNAYRPIALGAVAPSLQEERTSFSAFLPGFAFFVAMLIYCCSGWICVLNAPGPTTAFDGHAIPDTAACVRVRRR